MPRELKQIFVGLGVFDEAADCVVASAYPSFGLELQIRSQARLWASNEAVITELVLHFPEQYASRIHVRLRDKAESM
jgi:hypothetical protein